MFIVHNSEFEVHSPKNELVHVHVLQSDLIAWAHIHYPDMSVWRTDNKYTKILTMHKKYAF